MDRIRSWESSRNWAADATLAPMVAGDGQCDAELEPGEIMPPPTEQASTAAASAAASASG